MNDKKISVIIPFYKNKKWLFEAVESVFNQTLQPNEVIIINDASDENLDDFLEKYADQIIYKRINHSGPAIARNVGIDISNGEFVAFLDSDDFWLPQKLEKQINAMIKTNFLWSYSSYSTFIDSDINSSNERIIKVKRSENKSFCDFFSSCNIATPTVVIKGDILRGNNNLKFIEDMRYGEDTCFWLKISENYEPLVLDDVLVKVRLRGTNAAKIASVQLNARAAIWDRYKNKRDFLVKNGIHKKVLFAYKTCYNNSKFILKINKIIDNKGFIEFISKVLYILPWLVFKIDYIRSINKN